MKTLIIFLVLINTAFAKTLKIDANGDYQLTKSEFQIEALVKDYAYLKKLNLIMNRPPMGTLVSYGPKTIKGADLDLYVSAALNDLNYTIVENKELNQITVMAGREVRYNGGALHTDIATVPNDYNMTMFSIKLKHVKSSDFTRNMRPFISRYGRLISEVNSNVLIISDNGKNIRRIYKLIEALDTPLYIKNTEYLKNLNKKGKRTIKKKTSLLEFVKDQHVLFIIVFSLIFGILGFGIRGYMMKRIEGGW